MKTLLLTFIFVMPMIAFSQGRVKMAQDDDIEKFDKVLKTVKFAKQKREKEIKDGKEIEKEDREGKEIEKEDRKEERNLEKGDRKDEKREDKEKEKEDEKEKENEKHDSGN